MRFKERDQSSVRGYQRISLGKRKRLVELVEEQGHSLSKVVKKLKIKLTTARLILTKYRQTGQFPMRDFKKQTIKERPSSHQPLSQSDQDDIKLDDHQPSFLQAPQIQPQLTVPYQCVFFNLAGLYFFPYVYN